MMMTAWTKIQLKQQNVIYIIFGTIKLIFINTSKYLSTWKIKNLFIYSFTTPWCLILAGLPKVFIRPVKVQLRLWKTIKQLHIIHGCNILNLWKNEKNIHLANTRTGELMQWYWFHKIIFLRNIRLYIWNCHKNCVLFIIN